MIPPHQASSKLTEEPLSDDRGEKKNGACLIRAFGRDRKTAEYLLEVLEGAVEDEETWESFLEPFLEPFRLVDLKTAIEILTSDRDSLQKARVFLANSPDSAIGLAFADSVRSQSPQQSSIEQVSPYERFSNPRRTVMDGAHNRAVSLKQLRLVFAYIGEQADVDGFLPWKDWNPASNTYGCQLHVDTVNLYHLVEWVIKPVTKENQCSIVEILSDDKQQPPKWFVSHVWCEPIKNFLLSIEEHSHVRGLSEDDFWWVCGYANNQHSIDDDINIDPDPRKTSFYRAMQQCEGVLLCVDSLANPFTRIWCCFEEAMIVNDGEKSLKLDICTVVGGKGVVLTDGLVDSDLIEGPKYALERKRGREREFPLELLERGYSIDVRKATASHESDIRRILNAIAGAPANELDSRDPDLSHPSFDTTNQALRGIFAEAATCKAAESGRLEVLLNVLREDIKRTTLTLNLGGCPKELDLSPLKCLAGHPNLARISLDCAYCSIPSMEGIGNALAQLSRLREVSFNLSGCTLFDNTPFREFADVVSLTKLNLDMGYSALSDVSGIGAALKGLSKLEELRLDFAWCSKLDEVAPLSAGLASLLALKELNLNFRHCDVLVVLPELDCLHNLQRLSIDFSYTQTETKALSFLKGLKNLKHLELLFEGCKRLSHLSPLGAISNYQKMESLTLSLSNTSIGGAGALKNLDSAPRLVEANLNFSKCSRLRSVKWLPKAVSRMKHFSIDLSDCEGLPPTLRGVFDNIQRRHAASSSFESVSSIMVRGETLCSGETQDTSPEGHCHTVNSTRSHGSSQTSNSRRRAKIRNHAKYEAGNI